MSSVKLTQPALERRWFLRTAAPDGLDWSEAWPIRPDTDIALRLTRWFRAWT